MEEETGEFCLRSCTFRCMRSFAFVNQLNFLESAAGNISAVKRRRNCSYIAVTKAVISHTGVTSQPQTKNYLMNLREIYITNICPAKVHKYKVHKLKLISEKQDTSTVF